MSAFANINQQQMVLIVPLWNWNACENALRSELRGSNRTFMELKLERTSALCAAHDCSNRTFMELKFVMERAYIATAKF